MGVFKKMLTEELDEKTIFENKGDEMEIKETITLEVHWTLDEEQGYILEEDDLRAQFRRAMEDLENDISEINYERDLHLKTKHMEEPVEEGEK